MEYFLCYAECCRQIEQVRRVWRSSEASGASSAHADSRTQAHPTRQPDKRIHTPLNIENTRISAATYKHRSVSGTQDCLPPCCFVENVQINLFKGESESLRGKQCWQRAEVEGMLIMANWSRLLSFCFFHSLVLFVFYVQCAFCDKKTNVFFLQPATGKLWCRGLIASRLARCL